MLEQIDSQYIDCNKFELIVVEGGKLIYSQNEYCCRLFKSFSNKNNINVKRWI